MDFKDYDFYLDINGKSKHLNTDVEYNENNYGFGITAEKERLKSRVIDILTAGTYKNSHGNRSNYAGAGIGKKYGDEYYAVLGAIGGVVTGYEDTLSPLGALYAGLGKKGKARLNLMYAPSSADNPQLLMMNLGLPFK